MKNRLWQVSWLALGLAALPTLSEAHFRLLAPASWLVENQLGDPQKAAPCGGTRRTSCSLPPRLHLTDTKLRKNWKSLSPPFTNMM